MDGLTVSIDVDIRPLRDPDLSDLEWNGHQIAQVAAVRDARLRRGDEVIFLVAEANAYAVGRIGIDLTKRVSERVAHLWSFAVMPNLQRLGIGSALVRGAEDLASQSGFAATEIGVEDWNDAARLLYERLGYRPRGAERDERGETVLLLRRSLENRYRA